MRSMDGQTTFEAEGFLFSRQEDAELALSEKKQIGYLEEHLDFNNAEQIFSVYKKLIEEHTFSTPVGLGYLKELRQYLAENGFTDGVPPIPVSAVRPERNRETLPARHEGKKAHNPEKTVGYRISIVINLILAALVVAMFIITLKSDNPNILNYERTIQDKYAEWEMNLTDREEAVREKERALHIKEQ